MCRFCVGCVRTPLSHSIGTVFHGSVLIAAVANGHPISTRTQPHDHTHTHTHRANSERPMRVRLHSIRSCAVRALTVARVAFSQWLPDSQCVNIVSVSARAPHHRAARSPTRTATRTQSPAHPVFFRIISHYVCVSARVTHTHKSNSRHENQLQNEVNTQQLKKTITIIPYYNIDAEVCIWARILSSVCPTTTTTTTKTTTTVCSACAWVLCVRGFTYGNVFRPVCVCVVCARALYDKTSNPQRARVHPENYYVGIECVVWARLVLVQMCVCVWLYRKRARVCFRFVCTFALTHVPFFASPHKTVYNTLNVGDMIPELCR